MKVQNDGGTWHSAFIWDLEFCSCYKNHAYLSLYRCLWIAMPQFTIQEWLNHSWQEPTIQPEGRLKWIIMESNNKSRQLYCKLKDSNAVNPTWADNNPPCLSGYKNWELYTHKHDNMSRYTTWELYTRKHDNMSFKINMSIQKESRTSQNIVSFSHIYIGSVW